MRPIDETYADVEKLLWRICHRHQAKYGGDFDNLLGEAGLLFMAAYKDYDPKMGKFPTWLYQKVTYGLISATRNRRKVRVISSSDLIESGKLVVKNERGGRSHLEYDPQEPAKSKFHIGDFIAELGQDAKTVVQLLLETPADLLVIADNKGGQPRNLRSTVRQALAKEWGDQRVRASFDEVRGALQCN